MFENGWALLGETSKFVVVSPLRFQQVSTNGAEITAVIMGAPNESIYKTVTTKQDID